ncbi:MAG TPA: VCBS repeat-containing protein, partial [Acidimicrobiia bacterium]|nr:VCBS repeat-containing protein [Acidimicrobiia bacterium]
MQVEAVPAPPRVFRDVASRPRSGANPRSTAAGDVTGDGRTDLVVGFGQRVNFEWGQPAIGSVGLYDSSLPHDLEPELLTAPDGTEGTNSVVVGDLDGDGDQDVAAGTDAGVVVYERSGNGFAVGRLVPLPNVRDVELGDLDGDDRMDIIVTTAPAGLHWLRNNGERSFAVEAVAADTVADATTEDLDGNGRDEIIALACDGRCGSLLVAARSGAAFTLSSHDTTLTGTGPFRDRYEVDGDVYYPTRCAVGAADITRDGIADLFATCSDASRVEVVRGAADHSFYPASPSEGEFANPRGLRALDLDGDSFPELAVLNSDSIAVVEANPEGHLRYEAFIELDSDQRAFAFGDFDSDGTPDVAALPEESDLKIVSRPLVDSEFHGPRPWVRDTEPAEGSSTARPTVTPTIAFARPLDAARANNAVTLTNSSTGAAVEATSTYDAATNSIVVRPAAPLQPGHAYALSYEHVYDTDGRRGTMLEPTIRFTVADTASSAADPDPSGPGPTPPPAPPVVARPARTGYWMVGADGAVYGFGDAAYHGRATPAVGAAVVDLEPTPSGDGYWLADSLGTVTARGDALWYGNVDAGALAKEERVTSLSATPTGRGYWLFTNLGRVVAQGDATWMGDMSRVRLNGPVLDSIPTPTGRGYYMVASDGGIFAFGDAAFSGSMGGARLNAPVQSLVPDPDGRGYWLVASDGGVFAFDANFRGSMGDRRLNR